MKALQAGRPLNQAFNFTDKTLVQPEKALYTPSRLGSPEDSPRLEYRGRHVHISCVTSSPRDLAKLPSLKEFVKLSAAQLPQKARESSLEYKLKKLEHKLSPVRQAVTFEVPKEHRKSLRRQESSTESVASLFNKCQQFSVKQQEIKARLKDALATQQYDRGETVLRKAKHLNQSSPRDGDEVLRMRVAAERDRLAQYRQQEPLFQWYRELLDFALNGIGEITPAIHYVLDCIRGVLADVFPLTLKAIEEIRAGVPIEEQSRGLSELMNYISSSFPPGS